MKGSRVSVLLVGLTAALTLAACGIPTSDVIQAGAPASGIQPPSPRPAVPAAIPFYFLRNGELTPYVRKIGAPKGLGAIVGLLFDGPSPSEAVTATTELPRLRGAPEVTNYADNTSSIRLPKDVPALSHLAMLQLACTVAQVTLPGVPLPTGTNGDGGVQTPPDGAQNSTARRSVQVLGDGWTMTQSNDSCPGTQR
ncbi:hypothetical protein AB0D78_24325 [Streptomyces avermitilis]|uniref:hypothetical protein n=1 Tax=Streptomyces avermitilis TaxID=33903 RepID=UPI0033C056BF